MQALVPQLATAYTGAPTPRALNSAQAPARSWRNATDQTRERTLSSTSVQSPPHPTQPMMHLCILLRPQLRVCVHNFNVERRLKQHATQRIDRAGKILASEKVRGRSAHFKNPRYSPSKSLAPVPVCGARGAGVRDRSATYARGVAQGTRGRAQTLRLGLCATHGALDDLLPVLC